MIGVTKITQDQLVGRDRAILKITHKEPKISLIDMTLTGDDGSTEVVYELGQFTYRYSTSRIITSINSDLEYDTRIEIRRLGGWKGDFNLYIYHKTPVSDAVDTYLGFRQISPCLKVLPADQVSIEVEDPYYNLTYISMSHRYKGILENTPIFNTKTGFYPGFQDNSKHLIGHRDNRFPPESIQPGVSISDKYSQYDNRASRLIIKPDDKWADSPIITIQAIMTSGKIYYQVLDTSLSNCRDPYRVVINDDN